MFAFSCFGQRIFCSENSFIFFGRKIFHFFVQDSFNFGKIREIVFPFANQKGAISGALIGCTVGWIIFIGSKYYPATEFLTNRIPPEAHFAACTGPAEQWPRDIKSFATGNKFYY